MPSGVVPQLPPQLPPLPPQPSLATPSNWKLHYPPEDIIIPVSSSFPPSSWTTTSGPGPLRQTNSTSPRRLPNPSQQRVAGDSSSLSHPGHALSSSNPSSSSGRLAHSHSRSGPRVPLPVLPSASSAEPIVISPPTRTHSRSVSIPAIRPPPTSRPNHTGEDPHGIPPQPPAADKDVSRPLHKPPKHAPPPLPLLDQVPVREQSLPPRQTSAMIDGAALPIQTTSITRSPETPQSAPPLRPQVTRLNSSPRSTPSMDQRQTPSPTASPVPVPLPAPSRRSDRETGTEQGREKEKSRAKLNGHREFVVLSPDQPFMDARLPKRPPTPPKARSTGLPSTPAPKSRPGTAPSNRTHTASEHTPEPRLQDAPSARSPPPSASTAAARGQTVDLVLRPLPGLFTNNTNSISPAPSPQSLANITGYTRKWVVEKNGKRLTQDTMVVAQQLRMLR
ncbi:hypothetical protein BD311DRAFT_231087 [Dichomitus squalens]|uniref:Uncharacterized protein n=1 Tax=Dichomitus squalens TaxID=114155 RepID=A0A4Q9MSE8_9APHY|nr:hypothetical protein BD311DRAFT_231087 [Dichomitus squalens]